MDTAAAFAKPEITPERQAFYDRLDQKSIAPLSVISPRTSS